MTEPIHVRLVDERGVVHVDQDLVFDPNGTEDEAYDAGQLMATAHYDITEALDADGIRWRMEITDPDGDVPSFEFGTWGTPSVEQVRRRLLSAIFDDPEEDA